MRARYGVDPEALGLAGPNAFADAFDASLRGMELGENMATNALNREIARERAALAQEQAEQVRRDRAIQATVGTPVGSPSVATGGTASGSGKKKSSKTGTTSGFAPQSFSAFVRGQFEDEAEIRKLNETLAEYDDLRAKAGAGPGSAASFLMSPAGVTAARMPRETGGFDVASGLENPLTRINYLPDVLPTPREAAALIRERAAEFNLDSSGVARLVQDYENFYAQRAGQYQDTMSAMMQAQADAAAEAAELRNAQITRGLAIVQMLQDAERRNLPFPELTPEQIEDRAVALQYARQAYDIPSGQTQRLRSSELAAAAPMLRAQTEASEAEADRYLLEQARNEVYQQTVTEGLAEIERIANRVSELRASGVPDSELPVIPTEDDVRRRASAAMNSIIDVNSARDFFKSQEDSPGEVEVQGMTLEEAVSSLENMARRRGITVDPTDLRFAASEIIRDPKAVSQLRKGLVTMPSGATDATTRAIETIEKLTGVDTSPPPPRATEQPTPQQPTTQQPPTQTQPQATVTEMDDGSRVFDFQ
jgi:hypothetical protein